MAKDSRRVEIIYPNNRVTQSLNIPLSTKITHEYAVQLQEKKTKNALFWNVDLTQAIEINAFNYLRQSQTVKKYVFATSTNDEQQLCEIQFSTKSSQFFIAPELLINILKNAQLKNCTGIVLRNLTINKAFIDAFPSMKRVVTLRITESCDITDDAKIAQLCAVYPTINICCETQAHKLLVARSVLMNYNSNLSKLECDYFQIQNISARNYSYQNNRDADVKITVKSGVKFSEIKTAFEPLFRHLQNKRVEIVLDQVDDKWSKDFCDLIMPLYHNKDVRVKKNRREVEAITSANNRNRCFTIDPRNAQLLAISSTSNYEFSKADSDFFKQFSKNFPEITEIKIDKLRCHLAMHPEFFSALGSCEQLSVLSFQDTNFDQFQITELKKLLQKVPIKKVCFRNCVFTGQSTIFVLKDIVKSEWLTDLEIHSCDIKVPEYGEIGVLFKAIIGSSIKKLAISGVGFSEKEIPLLKELVCASQLDILDLSENRVFPTEQFCNILRDDESGTTTLVKVQYIKNEYNFLRNTSEPNYNNYFAAIQKRNKNLAELKAKSGEAECQEIDFKNSCLTDRHLSLLIDELERFPRVEQLNLSYNSFLSENSLDKLKTLILSGKVGCIHLGGYSSSDKLFASLKMETMYCSAHAHSQSPTKFADCRTLEILNHRLNKLAQPVEADESGKTNLDFSTLKIDSNDMHYVVNLLKKSDQVERICFAGIEFTNNFLGAILNQINNFNNLSELDFSNCQYEPDFESNIAEFLVGRQTKPLAKINLNGVKKSTSKLVRLLKNHPHVYGTEFVGLSGSVDALRKRGLIFSSQDLDSEELDLSSICVIDNEDFEFVAREIQRRPNVKRLKLSNNWINDKCLKVLLKRIDIFSLDVLDLSGNQISDKGLDLLFDLIKQPAFFTQVIVSHDAQHKNQCKLNQSYNRVHLIKRLKENKSDRSLTLSTVDLSESGLQQVLRCVKEHPNIRELDLSSLTLNDNTVEILCEYIKKTTILHVLNLNTARISALSMVHIINALQQNNSIYDLRLNNIPSIVEANSTQLDDLVKLLRTKNILTTLTCVNTNFPCDYVPNLTNKNDFNQRGWYKHSDRKYTKSWAMYKQAQSKAKPILAKAKKMVTSLRKKKAKQEHPNQSLTNCELLVSREAAHCPQTELISFTKANTARANKVFILFNDSNATTRNLKKAITTNRISPYHRFKDGDTMLHLAVRLKKPQLVKHIMSLYPHFDIDIYNAAEESPLSLALAIGDKNIVDMLQNPGQLQLPNPSTATLLEQPQHEDQSEGSAPESRQKKSRVEVQELQQLVAVPPSQMVVPINQLEFQLTSAIFSGNVIGLRACLQGHEPTLIIQGKTLYHLAIEAQQFEIVCMLRSQYHLPVDMRSSQGLTPLQFIVQSNVGFVSSPVVLKIAKFLLDNGASLTVDDNDLFLISVSRGHYKLTKLLLSYKVDINKHTLNHTCLTICIDQGHTELLQRLLIDARLHKQTVEHALEFYKKKFHVDERPAKKSKNLVFELLQNRLEKGFVVAEQNVQWCRSMDVVYGARESQRGVVVPSEQIHWQLFRQNQYNQQRTLNAAVYMADELDNNIGDSGDNPVTLCVSFVFTPPAPQFAQKPKRQVVSIYIDMNKEFHITSPSEDVNYDSQEVRQTISKRIAAGLAMLFNKEILPNRISEESVLNSEYVNQQDFQQLFHHGEQALLSALEEDELVGYLVAKLTREISPGSKIHGVVLDINSPRYVCVNCQVGILGVHNPNQSLFLQLLTKKLVNEGLQIPRLSPIKMITRVSSYIEFAQNKGPQVTAEDHLQLCVDMRGANNRYILQQDIYKSIDPRAQFASRK